MFDGILIKRIQFHIFFKTMKLSHKIRSLAGIVFLAATLVLSACTNGPAALSFEIINKQTGYVNNTTTASAIEIITSQTMVSLTILEPEDQIAIESVDYSRYFVAIVTFGHGYPYQNNVTKISQFKEVVWVQTNLDPSSTDGSSNYQIVKISRDDMIRYGKITFRLLDNQMGEIGKAVQTISAP
jgi:hypothetical protein